MSGLWIWVTALALYAAFRLWYDNWRGPLGPEEIERLLARLGELPIGSESELAALRAFLDADDGREFVMLNLVRLAPGEVPHPESGERMPAMKVLEQYTKDFFPALLRRGGHPAIAARKVGGYLDTWNVEPDPGWTLVGFMRYRSRRDMMELVTDPRFANAHAFKVAATPVTLSFPTSARLMLFPSPRIWVGLVLAAALGHLALLLLA